MFFVFVDTQSFRKASFGFDSHPSLAALLNAVKDRRITVLMTDITIKEVRRLLEKGVEDAFQAVKKAVRDNYLLKASPLIDLDHVRLAKKEDVVQAAIQQWEMYLNSLAPTIVDIDTVAPSEVMSAFFSQKPPFSAKKPNEFRDAFVLRALHKWAENEDQQIFVVSEDPDHVSACDGVRLVSRENLTDAIAECRDDDALTEQARESLEAQRDRLQEILSERLPEMPLVIEDDPDAEAEDHLIESIDFDSEEFVLVDFRDGHVSISGSIDVWFSFSATISDYANGIIDEGDWVVLPHYTYSIRTKAELRISVQMMFGGAPAKAGDIELVQFESPAHIKVSMDDSNVESKVIRGWDDDE